MMRLEQFHSLAGLLARQQAFLTRRREHALELGGRMADFAGIEADAVNAIQPGLGLGQRLERVFFGQMTQETHDQLVGDAILVLRGIKRRENALDRRVEGQAAFGMALRVEEHLDMADIVGLAALQIGVGQIVKSASVWSTDMP